MKGRGGVVFTCSLLPPDADADASGGPWRSRGKEDKTMDSGREQGEPGWNAGRIKRITYAPLCLKRAPFYCVCRISRDARHVAALCSFRAHSALIPRPNDRNNHSFTQPLHKPIKIKNKKRKKKKNEEKKEARWVALRTFTYLLTKSPVHSSPLPLVLFFWKHPWIRLDDGE